MRHPDIVSICEKHKITLEAWGPLARAQRFDHPSIVKVAKKHGKDQAQIFLRWGLQHVSVPHAARQTNHAGLRGHTKVCFTPADRVKRAGL
jgi:diketogulonate reductase-like aldo/keto reductase